MPELSAPLTQQLINVLDCTVSLRRGVDDRSTTVSIVVTTAWDAEDVAAADRDLLTRHVFGEPNEEGWLTAQVAALHGYLFDLSGVEDDAGAEAVRCCVAEVGERAAARGIE